MSFIIFNQTGSPSLPSSGKTLLYNTSGKILATKDDGAVIREYGQNAIASKISDSVTVTTVETIIAGGSLNNGRIYANQLQSGTIIKAVMQGTCTTTVANATTWRFRIGTAGSTSDGVLMSAANSVAGTTGTNIPFVAELVMTVRTTGAAATAVGYLQLATTGTTGISAVTWQAVKGTMSTFDSTVDNYLSATCVTAAATTACIFQNAWLEVIKI